MNNKIDFEEMREKSPDFMARIETLAEGLADCTKVNEYLSQDFVDGTQFVLFVLKKLNDMGFPITQEFLADFGIAIEWLLWSKQEREDFSGLATIPDEILFHKEPFLSRGEKDECEFK